LSSVQFQSDQSDHFGAENANQSLCLWRLITKTSCTCWQISIWERQWILEYRISNNLDSGLDSTRHSRRWRQL